MDNIRYSLGLDIGIGSVGWAVLENDVTGEPFRIERLGSRIFERAEVPKTGASLAADRRQARSARRMIRRRRHRKERIRQLLIAAGLLSRVQLADLFSHPFSESVYELRVRALEQLLTAEETARLLIHFAQRRGYQSNSKSEEAKNKKENRPVKHCLSENEKRMKEGGYRTVGEMYWKDNFFWLGNRQVHIVHNKGEVHKTTVTRRMLLEELNRIFEAQRSFGAAWATPEFQESYLAIWGGQRDFDEGPGGNSKYGGFQIEKMLGKCTFEKEKSRAPKASYTAERFRLLQTVNNIKVVGHGMPPEFLDAKQRKAVIALAMKSTDVNYAQIRKAIALPDDYLFNALRYGDKATEEVEKKTKFKQMQFYHKLRVALNAVEKNLIQTLTPEQRDEIARITTFHKSDKRRREEYRAAGFPEAWDNALLELSASKAAHLSFEAMQKLLPYLEEGKTYYNACKAVYPDEEPKPKKRLSLYDAEEIYNPVVKRAVSQAIKLINAIVRLYGPPEVVRVELAREVGKSKKIRDQIDAQNKEREKRNEKARNSVSEYKSGTITGQDIIKYKLYEDQKGICPYSYPIQEIDLARLFEPGYVEIDHILPYSTTFDDSYNNKVLVLSAENRQKGNKIPYDYFGSDPAHWDAFETLVQDYPYQKRKRLLTKKLSEEQANGFRERNLKDTQYLSRVIFRLIEKHLQFNETGNYKKQKTFPVNGAITAYVRKRLGIEKIRADGDLHHARDAAVIACISHGMTQKITNFSKQCEQIYATSKGYVDMETGEVLTRADYIERYSPHFPAPWERFRQELEARLSNDPQGEIERLHLNTYDSEREISPVFVSRMPRHKVTGAAHEATIRSGKKAEGTVSKTELANLKLNKEGEIEGYYNLESDLLLYNALKERLQQYGGDGKAAFAEPFHKPKHDGTQGPLVKKVKVYKYATLTIPTGTGVAENEKRVRVDVFHVDGEGYYFVPIYVPDTVKPELPNRAVVQGKSYDQWKVMREEDFLFSLCAGDLIHIVNKKEVKLNLAKGAHGAAELLKKDYLYYYTGLDISDGRISLESHDRKYKGRTGGKTLGLIEKYEVDVLGNHHPVKLPEKRMKFGD